MSEIQAVAWDCEALGFEAESPCESCVRAGYCQSSDPVHPEETK